IGRAVGARPGTALRRVADAGRGAALGARRDKRVRRAVVAHAVAALRDVADPGRRPADVRALPVGRTVGARPVAALRRIANATRGSAFRPSVPRVVLAGIVGSIAEVSRADVAVVGAARPGRD